MHRQMGQTSLAESLLPQSLGRNERLERIGEEVDWERFPFWWRESTRPTQLSSVDEVKVLLLEQSTCLTRRSLGDRISFRRFVGLGLQDETPDYSTISRFRTELVKHGLSEELFKELEVQLDKRGLVDGHAGRGPRASSTPRCGTWRQECYRPPASPWDTAAGRRRRFLLRPGPNV